jgi:hypothetical protein
MGLKSRVAKLEAAAGGGEGRCTCTPGFIAVEGDDYYPEPTGSHCPSCGLLPLIVVRFDPNFYGNAHLYEELRRRDET